MLRELYFCLVPVVLIVGIVGSICAIFLPTFISEMRTKNDKD